MPTYEFEDPETGERSDHVLEMSEVCGYGETMELGGKTLTRVFEAATGGVKLDGFAREELCFTSNSEPRRFPGTPGYDHAPRDEHGRPRFQTQAEVARYVKLERMAGRENLSFGEL